MPDSLFGFGLGWKFVVLKLFPSVRCRGGGNGGGGDGDDDDVADVGGGGDDVAFVPPSSSSSPLSADQCDAM